MQLQQQRQPPPSTSASSTDEVQPPTTRAISPISQLLETLGMTREDLSKRSAQMREFLTAESSNLTNNFNEFSTTSYSRTGASDDTFGTVSYGKNTTTSTSAFKDYATAQTSTTSTNISVATVPSDRTSVVESHQSVSRERPSPGSTSISVSMPATLLNASSTSSIYAMPRKRDSTRYASSRDKHSHHSHRSSGSSHIASPMRSKPSLDEIMQMRARESASRRSRAPRQYPETSDDSSDETPDLDVFSSSSHCAASRNDAKNSTSPYYQSDTDRKSFYRGTRTLAQTAAHYRRDHYPKIAASSPYYRSTDRPTTTQLVVAQVVETPVEEVSIPPPQNDVKPEEVAVEEQSSVMPSSATYFRKTYDETPNIPSSSPMSVRSISSNAHMRSDSKTSDFSSPSKSSSFGDEFDFRDPDLLPYTLPPGPYSEEKPDLSYAAMIGRAIIASPNHRLKLKDIYEYISTVFPYFKRPLPGAGGSHAQKWMNAIRQNLTNTPQFRKVGLLHGEYDSSKDSAKGGWWAIMDEDLCCFKDGGYTRRALDGIGLRVEIEMDRENTAIDGGSKADKRKRKEVNDEISTSSSSQPTKKRVRRGQTSSTSASSSIGIPHVLNPYHFPYNSSGQLVQMPPTFAGLGQHAYYVSAQPGMVLPYIPGQQTPYGYTLLPQAENMVNVNAYIALMNQVSIASSSNDGDISEALSAQTSPVVETPGYIEGIDISYESQSRSPLDSSPDLTPNKNSEPEVIYPDDVFSVSGGDEERASNKGKNSAKETKVDKGKSEGSVLPVVISGDMGISPRRVFGGFSPATVTEEVLKPSIDILGKDTTKDKGKKKGKKNQYNTSLPMHAFPPSPTMQRKTSRKGKEPEIPFKLCSSVGLSSSSSRPSTPPRDSTTHPLSSIRTPIKTSSKSPGTSKANLHAVPPFGDHLDIGNSSVLRTPSRTRTITDNSSMLPITPGGKFYTTSPFSSLPGIGFSPFRTPSRRVLFDPHDPGNLLEEEIAHINSLEMLDSIATPVGAFAEKGLLYESPFLPSPSAWTRPW